ncbi:MAG: hypothetical protein JO305_05810 [Alphaproteobacteria bacterium]|nr:hypothetical protein [Alphaproteobacteria bacterium]
MPSASLTVPGFNNGNPLPLLNFAFTPALRSLGGGRSGRMADWAGSFEVESPALAESLDDHLAHTFEEGHSAVSEIAEHSDEGRFHYGGVALRHRGGAKFTFDAASRERLQP